MVASTILTNIGVKTIAAGVTITALSTAAGYGISEATNPVVEEVIIDEDAQEKAGKEAVLAGIKKDVEKLNARDGQCIEKVKAGFIAAREKAGNTGAYNQSTDGFKGSENEECSHITNHEVDDAMFKTALDSLVQQKQQLQSQQQSQRQS